MAKCCVLTRFSHALDVFIFQDSYAYQQDGATTTTLALWPVARTHLIIIIKNIISSHRSIVVWKTDEEKKSEAARRLSDKERIKAGRWRRWDVNNFYGKIMKIKLVSVTPIEPRVREDGAVTQLIVLFQGNIFISASRAGFVDGCLSDLGDTDEDLPLWHRSFEWIYITTSGMIDDDVVSSPTQRQTKFIIELSRESFHKFQPDLT